MQQTVRAAKRPIHTSLILPGSKSMTVRALLLAAFADGVSEIAGIYINDDIRSYVNALHQLGIAIQLDEKSRTCIVAGSNGKFPKKQCTVWCAGTKTTARFLMTACATTPGVYYFDGSTSIRDQSFASLLNILCRQGAQLIPSDTRKMPFTLMGSDSLEGGELHFSKKIASQLISALLIISPYARSTFSFNLPTTINSSYIDMTCSLMAEFGVLVHRVHQRQFMVPVPQRYQPKDLAIEPDFSIATYFFAAAAVTGGELTIQATKPTESKQPDAKFLTILEKMGCHTQETSLGLTLKAPKELQGVEVSLREFSDSFMALIGIAPFTTSPIRISHSGPMNTKETLRLNKVKTLLIQMGIHVETGEDWIKIFPGSPKAIQIDLEDDARIAFAFSIIGLKSPGVVFDHIDCVNKTFPDFFALWDQLTEHSNISA